MKKINFSDFPNVIFGQNVIISSESVFIGDGTIIEDDVEIIAKNLYIGYNAKIEKQTKIKALNSVTTEVYIGDNCFIGFGNQIMVPKFEICDYSQLHNNCLCSGYKDLIIGFNCWIGQHSILNSTESLVLKNNVRIGTQSQLWTHVASGELLEGCTLYGNSPLLIEDDVWIVGGAVISPGLILKEKSIIMTGSVLTKSTEAKNTYAGVPARNVTDKLSFWKDININEKFKMIKNFVNDFVIQFPEYENNIILCEELNEETLIDSNIYIVKTFVKTSKISVPIFFVENKKYIKTRQKIEIDFIKFCLGFRARFIPIN